MPFHVLTTLTFRRQCRFCCEHEQLNVPTTSFNNYVLGFGLYKQANARQNHAKQGLRTSPFFPRPRMSQKLREGNEVKHAKGLWTCTAQILWLSAYLIIPLRLLAPDTKLGAWHLHTNQGWGVKVEAGEPADRRRQSLDLNRLPHSPPNPIDRESRLWVSACRGGRLFVKGTSEGSRHALCGCAGPGSDRRSLSGPCAQRPEAGAGTNRSRRSRWYQKLTPWDTKIRGCQRHLFYLLLLCFVACAVLSMKP